MRPWCTPRPAPCFGSGRRRQRRRWAAGGRSGSSAVISAPRRWAARPPCSRLPTPRGLQPRPLGTGGRRLRIRSLALSSLPHGPFTRRAGPGRPPEGEGEGTSALFVTTESIVCEEPAPAGDRAERGAGEPDGGGARRGERGSERRREAGAGRPRSLARAGRGRGGNEGGREGGRLCPALPGVERTNGGSPRRKVQSSAAPREHPPPQPPPAAEQ